MASEAQPERALALVREHLGPGQRAYIGVTDVIDPAVESAETVRDRVLAAAEHIPVAQLGTTDDCGFSPFGDDVGTSREVAFAKVAARVRGTAMAAARLGV
jgi:5-methyltetrahydropteroyltriglutamate--homocysteine methyltransferase